MWSRRRRRVLTCERVFLLVIVRRKAPGECLVWFAHVRVGIEPVEPGLVHHVHVPTTGRPLLVVVVGVALLAVAEAGDGGLVPRADGAQAQAHAVAPVGVDGDDQEAAKEKFL